MKSGASMNSTESVLRKLRMLVKSGSLERIALAVEASAPRRGARQRVISTVTALEATPSTTTRAVNAPVATAVTVG